jgi:hypothetical protein
MSSDLNPLPGAQVELDPGEFSTSTNLQGEFTITNVAPGTYTVTINYLGFSQFTKSVVVAAGQMVKVEAVLEVARVNDTVEVTAGRSYGEVEAINEIRASDAILSDHQFTQRQRGRRSRAPAGRDSRT